MLTMLVELTITHPTDDAKLVVKMILKGRYANLFWMGVLALTNLLPLVLLFIKIDMLTIGASVLALVGIYLTEKIWIEAPQRISLT